jgi:hypothetical protein
MATEPTETSDPESKRVRGSAANKKWNFAFSILSVLVTAGISPIVPSIHEQGWAFFFGRELELKTFDRRDYLPRLFQRKNITLNVPIEGRPDKTVRNFSIVDLQIYNRTARDPENGIELVFHCAQSAAKLLDCDIQPLKGSADGVVMPLPSTDPDNRVFHLTRLPSGSDDWYDAIFVFEGAEPSPVTVTSRTPGINFKPYSYWRGRVEKRAVEFVIIFGILMVFFRVVFLGVRKLRSRRTR